MCDVQHHNYYYSDLLCLSTNLAYNYFFAHFVVIQHVLMVEIYTWARAVRRGTTGS